MADTDKDPISVLLVEDDPGHAVLIQKNLRRGGLDAEIITVDDGKKAVDLIRGRAGASAVGRHAPMIILLDLNLPVLDGYQVLKKLKNEAETRHIPIIMLTTTDTPHEVQKCYELGCNLYLSKPVDYETFTETIRSLGAFLAIVKLPKA
jgi:CheY-like chemotaxis protein